MQPDSSDHKRTSVDTTMITPQPSDARLSATAFDTLSAGADGQTLKLIPWTDIWSSLRVARVRGNGEMIEVFYDTLFREAIFDDQGAWSWNTNKRN